MQLALGTRKGWWDEDRPSRGPHSKKRSTNRGRSSSSSGHTQGSQSQTVSTHLGSWASTVSLLSSPRPSPPRRAAGKQNSTPLVPFGPHQLTPEGRGGGGGE